MNHVFHYPINTRYRGYYVHSVTTVRAHNTTVIIADVQRYYKTMYRSHSIQTVVVKVHGCWVNPRHLLDYVIAEANKHQPDNKEKISEFSY